MTKPVTPTDTITPLAPTRGTPPTIRRTTPPPPTARAAVPPAVAKATARPPADPPWAIAVRVAVDALAAAEDRLRQAEARVPVLQREIADARMALAREEASGPIEGSGRLTDGSIAARDRLAAAETEAARTARIIGALSETVQERRAALRPLLEPAREGLLLRLDQELADLDVEFRTAIEAAVRVAAKAVALADGSGAAYLAEPVMRARWPASLLRAEVVAQVGTLQGMVAPEATDASERAAALHELVVAARAAAQPATTTSTAAKEAA